MESILIRSARNIITSFIKYPNIFRMYQYAVEYFKFKRMGGRIKILYPIVSDYTSENGTNSGHYFHQDLLVASYIYAKNPNSHLDVGSRMDGFVAHVASFRRITVLDIRSLQKSVHSNIEYIQSDATSLNSSYKKKFDSVSCLHALEHFGLGRYSDKIDPDAHIKGFKFLCDALESGGVLYLSVPVSIETRVEFNAHRVFDVNEPILWGKNNSMTLVRFDCVDDHGNLHLNCNFIHASKQRFGLGIYSFKKC